MSKVLIVSGQFVPFTKSLGGILRVYAFSQSLVKKNHKVFLLVSKNSLNKNYGYLGLLKKDLRKIKIKYIQSKNTQISNSIFNFKLLRNIFYLLGFDYAFNLNNKYYEECLKIIESNNIDYLIVSSPPFSIFYIIERIKKKFKNLKIILDYRDGWTTRIENILTYPIKYFMTNIFEKKILNMSDYVLTATSHINLKIKNICKNKKKIFLLRNGFLIKPKRIKKKNKVIKIGYFGLISEDSSSYRNINIIYDVINSNKILKNKFIFEFYGNNIIKSKKIKNFKNFKFKNNLNYKKALSKMTEMDYLLILHTEKSTSKEMVTSKFYDYLASGTYIINISCGKNEVSKIIKKLEIGQSIDYQEEDLAKFLLKLDNKRKKLNWSKKMDFFSREHQNKILLNKIE